jgi:hypothetical protein
VPRSTSLTLRHSNRYDNVPQLVRLPDGRGKRENVGGSVDTGEPAVQPPHLSVGHQNHHQRAAHPRRRDTRKPAPQPRIGRTPAEPVRDRDPQ